MNALAMPPSLAAAAALAAASSVPAAASPVLSAGVASLPAADCVAQANCVAQAAALLVLACHRGQLEDASATARATLPLAQPGSPHQAMLQALADAQPVLMAAPEERRLYMLRGSDGVSHGVLRLRDNQRVAHTAAAGITRWRQRDGNLELCDASGAASHRFMLCGDRAGLRLYLGARSADGAPCLLQELRCTYTRLSLLDAELLDPFCSLYGADALVPDALPQRAALLLAGPHSHADALAQVLNRSSGVHFDAELLHPQGVRMGPTDRPLHAAAERCLHALRAKDAPWFARMMLARSHDVLGRHLGGMAVRGFCMAPAHSQAALDWALAEPALRIVHVLRSNLLAQFADTLAAEQADTSAPLHFEPERFGRFIEMTQRQHTALRQRLVQRNGDTVEVDASRLNAATVAELLGFLTDRDNPAGIACDGVSAATQRVISRFHNPESVLPCLRALRRLGWAEAEGQVS